LALDAVWLRASRVEQRKARDAAVCWCTQGVE